jgi:hypothetical protein
MFFLVLPLMDVSDVAMWCFVSCFGTSAMYDLLLVTSWKFQVASMLCLNVVWYLVVCFL